MIKRLFVGLLSCFIFLVSFPVLGWQNVNQDLMRLMHIRDFADFDPRDGGGLLDDPALTAVTREFGPSVIKVKRFPFKSELAVAAPVPWSSWWFPKKDTLLFKDGDSPLAKYDLLRKRLYRTNPTGPAPTSAVDFEQKDYNPNVAPWEGLCDAWSIAALSGPEPKKSVTMKVGGQSILFKVSDLKALLLKTYEGVEDSNFKYYGQKFTGDFNGWIYPDIYPEQLQRLLEVQLFGKKQSFIMDHDPGIQVWNVPVYKANYVMDPIANQPNSVAVTAWLYSAESSHENEKEFVGLHEAVRIYHYVLTGVRDGEGNLVVQSGYWTSGADGVDSRRDHPDYILTFAHPNQLVRKSLNPALDIHLIDEILSKSY